MPCFWVYAVSWSNFLSIQSKLLLISWPVVTTRWFWSPKWSFWDHHCFPFDFKKYGTTPWSSFLLGMLSLSHLFHFFTFHRGFLVFTSGCAISIWGYWYFFLAVRFSCASSVCASWCTHVLPGRQGAALTHSSAILNQSLLCYVQFLTHASLTQNRFLWGSMVALHLFQNFPSLLWSTIAQLGWYSHIALWKWCFSTLLLFSMIQLMLHRSPVPLFFKSSLTSEVHVYAYCRVIGNLSITYQLKRDSN